MDPNEKLNIYVPSELKRKVYNDAMLFEIFKKDHRSLNVNGFLSMFLCGYHDSYRRENSENLSAVRDILDDTFLKDSKKDEIAERILKEVLLSVDEEDKNTELVPLSIKPTKNTQRIFKDIENEIQQHSYTISKYIRRMLISYFRKSICEREKIIFQNNYSFIQDSCKREQPIIFSLIWDDKCQHEVVPYRIATDYDEMFNYLICAENNYKTGEKEVRSYRLNRITQLSYGKSAQSMNNRIRELCNRTFELSPRYAINYEEEICVKLSDRGVKLYNRVYYGRPRYSKIEDNNDGHYYYFNCSVEQVFHYFRRFDKANAVVVAPLFLKQKMITFHREALLSYNENKEAIEDV